MRILSAGPVAFYGGWPGLPEGDRAGSADAKSEKWRYPLKAQGCFWVKGKSCGVAVFGGFRVCRVLFISYKASETKSFSDIE